MFDFDKYYEFYLSHHQDPRCRWMHVAANVMMIAYTVMVLLYFSLWWLLLAPLMVYPLAFLGHWMFEDHPPALLSSNPLKARLADWRMCYEVLTGKLR